MAGDQIDAVRVAAIGAACHRKIAPLFGDGRGWGEIVGRAEPPAPVLAEDRVIARVVVEIGNRRVETNPAEQLPEIGFRSRAGAPDFIGQQEIGPLGAVFRLVPGAQQGEGADHAVTAIAGFSVVAVEAAHQQDIFAADGFKAAVRDMKAAFGGKAQHSVLDARIVEAVFAGAEFREPETAVILDNRLRTGAAHRGAGIDQIAGLGDEFIGTIGIIGHDRIGSGLETREVERAVERAARSGRRDIETEPERAGPVIRPLQQIVEFFENGEAGVFFDYPAAPIIRH